MNKIKKALLEMDGMLVGLIWITIIWSVSIPLMTMEMWNTYLVSTGVITLGCFVHFYLIHRHLSSKDY